MAETTRPPRASASVSRSKTSTSETQSLADKLLSASLSKSNKLDKAPNPRTASVSASVSKMSLSSARLERDADRMIQASLSDPSSVSSSSQGSRPPSYRTKASEKRDRPEGTSSIADSIDIAKARKSQLKRELAEAYAAAPVRDTSELFKAACSTDLLFIIDLTGSMQPYIDSAKQQVRSIVDEISKTFLNEAQVRIAIVGYRDHSDSSNIEFQDFTTSTAQVESFLEGRHASGGDDAPEDVLGGLQQALHASWKHQTRCIVHIGDAPPHGCNMHDMSAHEDNYYIVGSEPHGLTYEPLLRKLTELNINYAMLRITAQTDRMVFNFAGCYGGGNARLLEKNRYYGQPFGSASGLAPSKSSKSTSFGKPKFEELQLGTTYNALCHLVVKTVTNSISRTAGRLSMTYSRMASKETRGEREASSSDFPAIWEEDEDSAGSDTDTVVRSKTVVPQWSTPGFLDQRMDVEGFCPAATLHNAKTLNAMMAQDENIKLNVAKLTVLARSESFDKGAMRTAHYARTSASTTRYVVKYFKKRDAGRVEVIEDMRIQALCKAFALEFNGLVRCEPPLDFITASCLEERATRGHRREGDCFALERLLEGTWVKYNNNSTYVNEDLVDDPFCQMAQAFSHFTFERSYGLLLINDLQGSGHLLTDPSIQTADPERFKLADTNLNAAGFKFFFSMHKCNKYCSKLGLESKKDMFRSGVFEFRKTWPTMDPVVCCSNMFCRSIVRLADSRKSEDHPGHCWCEDCFAQLRSFATTWICVEPGPNHEFTANEFFHESQGELPPRKCPDHREKPSAASSARAVGASLWNKSKAAMRGESISGRAW